MISRAQVTDPPDSSGTQNPPDTTIRATGRTGSVITSADTLGFTADTIITDTAKKDRAKIRFGKKNPRHSWKTATWMSAVLPGLGQVYNGKWWKVPIVYVALGVPIYFLIDNQVKYISYRDALRDKVNNIPNPLADQYQASQLITIRDGYRKNRDVFILVTAALYALNIVDALVDGHLYRFDVGEQLSMKIQPAAIYMPGINEGYVGLSFSLGFKKKS